MGPRRKPKSPRRHSESLTRTPSMSRRTFQWRYGWLTEVWKLQKSTYLLLRKVPFARLAREICNKFTPGFDFTWQAQALLALQEAVEAFLVHLFEDAYLLFLKDVQLARRI
ncbi:histone H3-like centromeric protein A [Dipodomys spectabilis]|uniref:histone H3-like centromeric protein A n=1 Tax=Dipodomys spectabilis TaxID=105255 RepID=UPI001C53ABA5|nr:histone H3-like centromeric protein A [Dipodomys spectabilis]